MEGNNSNLVDIKFEFDNESYQFFGNENDHVFKKIHDNCDFYERDLLDAISSYDLPDGVFIDVGANIGNHSVYFSKILGRFVEAFELCPIILDALKKNILINGVNELVSIRPIGLSEKHNWVKIQFNESNWGMTKIVPDDTVSDELLSKKVFVTALDDCISTDKNVSLIKIDVEGHELEVLKGARQTIRKCLPVIIAEAHNTQALKPIIKELSPYNYACISIMGATDTYVFVNRETHKDIYDLNFSSSIRKLRRLSTHPELQFERAMLEMERLKQLNQTYVRICYERSKEGNLKVPYKTEIDRLHSKYSDLFYDSVPEDKRRGLTYPRDLRSETKEMLRSRVPEKNLLRKQTRFPYLTEDVEFTRPVRIGIAAIPSRVKSLISTVWSLVDQADEIFVSLNGFSEIPENNLPEKVRFVINENIGDLAKFTFLDEEFSGYYFTCDDDIFYPPYYIQSIIYYLNKYDGKIVAGWHGSEILEPFEKYYDSKSRRVRTFGSTQLSPTLMHVLGTGCIGFDTEHIRPTMGLFETPNMADIYFALWGQEEKTPFLLVPHDRSEALDISYLNEGKDSISGLSIANEGGALDVSTLTNILVSARQWEKNPLPMQALSELTGAKSIKVLLIGRVAPERWHKGGIFASCLMMMRQLESVGCDVTAIEIEGPFEPIAMSLKEDYDIGFVYGGDQLAQDFYNVEKLIDIGEFGFPLFFNLSYNNASNRTQEIIQQIEKMKSNHGLFVFTDLVKDILSTKINASVPIMVVPKTIREDVIEHGAGIKLIDRKGVFCGDVSKLLNKEITPRGEEFIELLKESVGPDNITLVKQYDVKDVPEYLSDVRIISHQDNIAEQISMHRVYVHLNPYCTFEMLPLEAAYTGTPVVYTSMPQSLDEYIGDSGMKFSTKNELMTAVKLLMGDDKTWNMFSNRGIARGSHADWESRSVDLFRSIDSFLS